MTTNAPTSDGFSLASPSFVPVVSDRSAIEQAAIADYENGSLSFFEVQQLLGFDNRWDTEEWLGSRGVCMNYSMEDLEQDRQTLARIFGD
jgi:predicted HTH domain antitoxin